MKWKWNGHFNKWERDGSQNGNGAGIEQAQNRNACYMYVAQVVNENFLQLTVSDISTIRGFLNYEIT